MAIILSVRRTVESRDCHFGQMVMPVPFSGPAITRVQKAPHRSGKRAIHLH